MNLVLALLLIFPLVYSYIVTAGVGFGISVAGKKIYCTIYECCDNNWVPQNIQILDKYLSERVFGQPYINDIARLIRSHSLNQKPIKPLVLSFHGPSGTGKNYVTRLINDVLFKAGSSTRFSHVIIGTHGFYNHSDIEKLRADLLNDIEYAVMKCSLRSLIIIDEADKFMPGVLDTLRPLMDYHEKIDGVDYRHTIFILISNSGQEEIAKLSLNYTQKGKTKLDIPVQETEQLLRSFLYNNNNEQTSGYYHSTLIGSSQIDHYFAFFPMEISDVKNCIRAEAISRNITDIESCIDIVLERLVFVPSSSMQFSASGCKKIYSSVSAFCN